MFCYLSANGLILELFNSCMMRFRSASKLPKARKVHQDPETNGNSSEVPKKNGVGHGSTGVQELWQCSRRHKNALPSFACPKWTQLYRASHFCLILYKAYKSCKDSAWNLSSTQAHFTFLSPAENLTYFQNCWNQRLWNGAKHRSFFLHIPDKHKSRLTYHICWEPELHKDS